MPWSCDGPLANHIVAYESSANHEESLFCAFLLLSGIFGKFPAKGLKIFPIFPLMMVVRHSPNMLEQNPIFKTHTV